MSQHHRAQKWTTDAPNFRKAIEAQLPLPCVNRPCLEGGVVHKGDRWSVGHKPGHEAHRGKRATIADVGPAHVKCQRHEGGAIAARIVNGRKAASKQASKGLRPW